MEAILDGLIMGTVLSGLSPRAADGMEKDDEPAGELLPIAPDGHSSASSSSTAGADLATMHMLGQELLSNGDASGAVEQWEVALAEARAVELVDAEGVVAANLGSAYRSLGEHALAIQRGTSAVAIARRLGDRAAEGRRLCNLGSAYMCHGQLAKAVRLVQQALSISRELGDRTAEARRLGNLGIACRSAAAAPTAIAADGDSEEEEERRQALVEMAIEHHAAALTICSELGDRRGEGRRLGNLGTAYDQLGRKADALRHHTAALEISREIGDKRSEGRNLVNLGNTYYNHPDTDDALDGSDAEEERAGAAATEHYRQALAIFEATGDERGKQSLRRVLLAASPKGLSAPEPEPEPEQRKQQQQQQQQRHGRSSAISAATSGSGTFRNAGLRVGLSIIRDGPVSVDEENDSEKKGRSGGGGGGGGGGGDGKKESSKEVGEVVEQAVRMRNELRLVRAAAHQRPTWRTAVCFCCCYVSLLLLRGVRAEPCDKRASCT
jgi:tetratricopeptide (TPR) repeat protein